MRRHIAAFTLIEILVVLSIIALLTALLFPTFTAARAKGRQASCASNLRQIGVALTLYAQDNEELYPVATDTSDHATLSWSGRTPTYTSLLAKAPTLRDVLQSYTRATDLWRCPSDTGGCTHVALTDAVGDITFWAPCTEIYGAHGTSYLYRAELGAGGVRYPATATDNALPPNTLEPSEVGILTDAVGTWHGSPRAEQAYDSGWLQQNMLYADGHVKIARETDFFRAWLFNLDDTR